MTRRRLARWSLPQSSGRGACRRRSPSAGRWRTNTPRRPFTVRAISSLRAAAPGRSGGRITITHSFDASLGYRSKDLLQAVAAHRDRRRHVYRRPRRCAPDFPSCRRCPSSPSLRTRLASSPTWRGPSTSVCSGRQNRTPVSNRPWPPAGIWAKKFRDGMEALQGLRIRTPDANGTATFRAAGALPRRSPSADALPRLKSGEIDAVAFLGRRRAGQRSLGVPEPFHRHQPTR